VQRAYFILFFFSIQSDFFSEADFYSWYSKVGEGDNIQRSTDLWAQKNVRRAQQGWY
jgi:hypothetical protein